MESAAIGASACRWWLRAPTAAKRVLKFFTAQIGNGLTPRNPR
jgi:hypothetical protein